MKPACLLLSLAVSGAIGAEQTDPCIGMEGVALTQCRGTQETRRQQERLEQLLKQQQERQVELDKQQRDVQQQLESMRLQNEALRKQLESEIANAPARVAAASPADLAKSKEQKNQELQSWKAENPWFGSDYPKTQVAMRYAKQLQQERPDLTGRPLLDALSAKVNETFGGKH